MIVIDKEVRGASRPCGDCAGRPRPVRLSDGEFEPNVNETSDGVDMIAWAVAQPRSAGVVGTFGGS